MIDHAALVKAKATNKATDKSTNKAANKGAKKANGRTAKAA
jgi:hypothetical protein